MAEIQRGLRQPQRLSTDELAVLIEAKRQKDAAAETHGGIHNVIACVQLKQATEQDGE